MNQNNSLELSFPGGGLPLANSDDSLSEGSPPVDTLIRHQLNKPSIKRSRQVYSDDSGSDSGPSTKRHFGTALRVDNAKPNFLPLAITEDYEEDFWPPPISQESYTRKAVAKARRKVHRTE